MYKCTSCGAEFAGDGLTGGMKVRCPNCRAICEDVGHEPLFVCSECGLACSSLNEKCPACGGIVVDSKCKDGNNEADIRVTDSGKKKISEVLGGYTFVVLMGIWSCVIFPIIAVALNGVSGCDPAVIYPWLAMAVGAGFLLSLYYTDNVRVLKWIYFYSIACGLLNVYLTLYAKSVYADNRMPTNGIFVWLIVAFLFRKYRKL